MSHLVDRPEVEKGDLGRSRSVSAHVYQDFMNCHIPPDLASCLNTLPVPISRNFFFLLYAAWVRSRAERPSVSYTKVVMEVAWTGHNLQFTKTN